MVNQFLLSRIRYLALGFILGILYTSVIYGITFTSENIHNNTTVDVFTFSYYRHLLKEMTQDKYLVLKLSIL